MADASLHGTFPFGRPNAARPLRAARAERADALVLGVHASAFHIAWSPPADVDRRPAPQRARAYLGALAVDVEPVASWDGHDPRPDELLAQWKRDVAFDEHDWGTARVGANGPSGSGLRDDYLVPLGLADAQVAYADVVPWYFTASGSGSQGNARERLAGFAKLLEIPLGELPGRPATRTLVAIATGEDRRESLRAEMVDAGAPLVITLGDEALMTVLAIADHVDGPPVRLADDASYGRPATILIDGHEMRWLALMDPELLRKQERTSTWRHQHRAWKARSRVARIV